MKTSKVSTPLTIVAIFAGLAEVAGASVLPLIDSKLQSVFIWYVMLFPLILLVSFFLTWNFNSKVLYPPSEFKDEKNYLNLLGIEVQEEIINLQSKNLDNLQQQLLEVKNFINKKSTTNKDQQSHDQVQSGKKPEETGQTSQTSNQSDEKDRKNYEVEAITEKLDKVLHNVEAAQSYQQMVSQVVVRRNPALSKFTILKADGECELCKSDSGIKDGTPYLEVHHVIPLSEGGNDEYENMVALCPNCHKRVHLSNDSKKMQKELENILKRRRNNE